MNMRAQPSNVLDVKIYNQQNKCRNGWNRSINEFHLWFREIIVSFVNIVCTIDTRHICMSLSMFECLSVHVSCYYFIWTPARNDLLLMNILLTVTKYVFREIKILLCVFVVVVISAFDSPFTKSITRERTCDSERVRETLC